MTRAKTIKTICAACLTMGVVAAVLMMNFGGPARAGMQGFTVVELFTSQGCSSCPPADRLLGELANEDGVLALSFNVTYWDYIGWKDVFGRSEFTKRQRAYANSLNLRHVYTPQVVVNGVLEGVGSHRELVRDMMKRQAGLANVSVTLKLEGAAVKVMVPRGPIAMETVVNLVAIDRRNETRIERGENRGKVVTNYNTVRALKRIGTWDGQAINFTVPLADLGYSGGDGYAALLQDTASDRIVGAGVLWINGS